MASPRKDRIKVQTARMLEVYALLKSEIEGKSGLSLTPRLHNSLQTAIDTIAANMQNIEAQITPSSADNSMPPSKPVEDLDAIVDAVLKWQSTNENGE